VTDMSYMFSIASSFNQPLGDWDVSNVENFNGLFAFSGCPGNVLLLQQSRFYV
jgi:hypothetical protein